MLRQLSGHITSMLEPGFATGSTVLYVPLVWKLKVGLALRANLPAPLSARKEDRMSFAPCQYAGCLLLQGRDLAHDLREEGIDRVGLLSRRGLTTIRRVTGIRTELIAVQPLHPENV